MSRQLLHWQNRNLQTICHMLFTMNYSFIKYLKGHLRCASMIRRVIKRNSSVLARADGVFIASVVVLLQKFIHNSRNPIFAGFQQIFRIRVLRIADLWQFPSNGLAKKPRKIPHLSCGEINGGRIYVRVPQIRAWITISGTGSQKRIGNSRSTGAQ